MHRGCRIRKVKCKTTGKELTINYNSTDQELLQVGIDLQNTIEQHKDDIKAIGYFAVTDTTTIRNLWTKPGINGAVYIQTGINYLNGMYGY